MTDASRKEEQRQPPLIALTIGDDAWTGWTYADIVSTMDAVSGSFSIGLTERWEDSTQRPIAAGSACTLTIDDEPVISGYIDVAMPFYGPDEAGVNITGRDRTGDLADCSADDGEWHNVGLGPLVAAIVKPFGLRVYSETDLGASFPRFRIQPGETAWAAIERATRARAVLAVASGDGNLSLIRAATESGDDPNPVALILGGERGTAAKATGTFAAHERFSRYRILAQQGGEIGSPEDRAHVVADATDPGIDRYRPLTIIADDRLDGAAALAQVRWEANVRCGRAFKASYTIVGWRDDYGRLWRPNTRVKVEDQILAISREMLVTSVRLTIRDDAFEADLDLSDPSAYLPAPMLPDEIDGATGKKKKKKKKGGDEIPGWGDDDSDEISGWGD